MNKLTNRSKSPQCADDRQSQKLVSASKVVLRESPKIRHVDSQRGEQADDNVEGSKGTVRSIHVC